MVNFYGRQGEGTLWEQFGGTINIGQGSRNHIMLGGFEGPFFYGNLAGIQNVGTAWCGDVSFARRFTLSTEYFTKTGSGQTQEKLRNERRTSSAAGTVPSLRQPLRET